MILCEVFNKCLRVVGFFPRLPLARRLGRSNHFIYFIQVAYAKRFVARRSLRNRLNATLAILPRSTIGLTDDVQIGALANAHPWSHFKTKLNYCFFFLVDRFVNRTAKFLYDLVTSFASFAGGDAMITLKKFFTPLVL